MKIKKNSLKIFIVFLFLNCAFCFGAQSSINLELSKIEKTIWGFEYSKDDVARRLSRIENNVFGTVNSKISNAQRIKKLNEAMGFESFEESQKQAYEIEQTEAADINYPQIDALEYQMFFATYENENIYKRLERLEKKIFGSTQDGNLASRTDKLKAYIKQDVVAQNPNYHIEQPYRQTQDIEEYMGSQNQDPELV